MRFSLGAALRRVVPFCVAAVLATSALAQSFPDRPVRIIVPAAAGGGLDILVRAIARELGEKWRQPVVVENRGGASGIVGTQEAITRGGDGHTLLAVTDSLLIGNRFAIKNIPFDIDRDLQPVTLLGAADQMLIAHPSLPANDLAELVALARKDPGRLTYGAWGDGSQPQLVYETLNSLANTQLTIVNYKGVSPVLVALAGNEVQLSVVSGGTAGPLLQAGKAKVLASASAQRLPGYANVPTTAEQGYPDLVSMIWFGLMAPTGMPAASVQKVVDDVAAVLANPAFREQQITGKGWRTMPVGPKEFETSVREYRQVLEKMFRAAKVVPQ